MRNRFKIVFEKFAEAHKESDKELGTFAREVSQLSDELDEIDELRRMAAEAAEPEPKSYTIG